MSKELTAREAGKAFCDFSRSVGPQADTYVSLRNSVLPITAALFPLGIVKGRAVEASGETFAEALQNLSAAWDEHRAKKRQQTVINMAVAIIRITDERGECLDRALRCEFSRQDVEDCGPDACVKANEMAGRGPFTISATTGLNAPAQFDDEAT